MLTIIDGGSKSKQEMKLPSTKIKMSPSPEGKENDHHLEPVTKVEFLGPLRNYSIRICILTESLRDSWAQ